NGMALDDVLQVGQQLEIPSQVATPMPAASPTVTPTPKKTSRTAPTPRPTALNAATMRYLSPILLAPANKYVFEGTDAAVMLNWNSVGILGKKQWYQVRIWVKADQEEPFTYYTKSTSWRPQVGFYNVDDAPYTIRWQVQVVEIGRNKNDIMLLSPASSSYQFYWR
ncbi:MAG: hypothetical protein ACYC6L_16765, partial [Anaerolineae bacterium]